MNDNISRTITSKPPANFTPNTGNYQTLQPFRYWCQKVLPLVYDDSLSYYELLCKVVDYLNKTMEDVETLHGDVTNLHTAYEKLQEYVNDYFSTLDVQEEINNKLDEMSKDGSLLSLVMPFISKYSSPIFVNATTEMKQTDRIYVLESSGHLYYYDGSSFIDSGLVYGVTPLFFTNGGANTTESTNLADLNDALVNRVYTFDRATTANLPYSGFRGVVVTFNNSNNAGNTFQMAVDLNNTQYYRIHNGFEWCKWKSGVDKNVINVTTNTELYNVLKSGVSNAIINISPGSYDIYTNLIENDINKNKPFYTILGDNVIINGNGSTITCIIPESVRSAHADACLNTSIINCNLNIEVNDINLKITNARYCIHDESISNERCYNTKHVFNNVYAESTGGTAGVFTRAIGIGGNLGQKYIFKNCEFNCDNVPNIFIHGRDYNIGRIEFKSCVFNKELELSQYTGNNIITNVNITNTKISTVVLSKIDGGKDNSQFFVRAINCGTVIFNNIIPSIKESENINL